MSCPLLNNVTWTNNPSEGDLHALRPHPHSVPHQASPTPHTKFSKNKRTRRFLEQEASSDPGDSKPAVSTYILRYMAMGQSPPTESHSATLSSSPDQIHQGTENGVLALKEYFKEEAPQTLKSQDSANRRALVW